MRKLIFALCALGAAPALAVDSTVYNQGDYTIVKKNATAEWTYVLTDNEAGSSVEVTQAGGNVTRFVAKVRGIQYNVMSSNSAWKMMPWPNRTKGGSFVDADGATRSLFIKGPSGEDLTQREGNGNAIHGYLRNRKWSAGGTGADAEGAYLMCYFDTQGYTELEGLFGAFRDWSIYRLKGNRLIIESYTENKGTKPLKNIGWGYHPWVNAPLVPLTGGQKGSKANTFMKMPAKTVATYGSDKIPTGSQPVATYNGGAFDFTRLKALGSASIDHFFTDIDEEQGSGYSRTALIDYGNAVRVQFLGSLPVYPWMVIFNTGSTVCIEHQTMETNGLNTKKHPIDVAAGAKSVVGRIIVDVDGDTTLSFQAPVAARPRGMLARPQAGARLAWNAGGGLFLLEARRGSYTIQGRAMRGQSLNTASGRNDKSIWYTKPSETLRQ